MPEPRGGWDERDDGRFVVHFPTSVEALGCTWRDGNDVVLEVANATPGSIRPAHRWDLQDQLRSGGRGLQIVQAFTDSVEIDQDDQGRLIVRCPRSLTDQT